MIATMPEPTAATGAPLLTLHKLRQIQRAANLGLGATASEAQAMLAVIQALHLWQDDGEQTELAERPAHMIEDHTLESVDQLIEAQLIDPDVFGPMLAEIRYYRAIVAHDGQQAPALTAAQRQELAQARRDAQRLAQLQAENERLKAQLAAEQASAAIQLELLNQIFDAFNVELDGEANPAAIPDYVRDVYRRLREIAQLALMETSQAALLRLSKIAKLADLNQ